MLSKGNLPEEGELVMCTISSIHYHSVFVRIEDYDRTGLIHISEVSPGRIRNIRDYVVEGKKVVCKVISINREKGHIDLSLRRVNEGEKRKKVDSIKQDQKCAKIIEFAAKTLKIDPKELQTKLSQQILKKYDQIYECFEDIVANNTSLAKVGVEKDIDDVLTALIMERIKPKEVIIKEHVKLTSHLSDGIDHIKAALSSAESVSENLEIVYAGGGKYKVTVTTPDYKSAEKIIEKVNSTVTKKIKDKGTAEFNRLK